MKVQRLLIAAVAVALATTAQAQVKVGSNPATISTNAVLDVEGSSGQHTVVLQNGNIGINNVAPSAKLEVTSGVANTSGIKMTNLTSAAIPVAGSPLGVDASGNVVVYSQLNGQKIFTVSTNGGAVNTNTPDGNFPVENEATTARPWILHPNTLKTLTVASPNSTVYMSVSGGYSLSGSSGGTYALAVGIFVDGQLKAVRNFRESPNASSTLNTSINFTGYVSSLSAGNHTFQLASLKRFSSPTNVDFYTFADATQIGGVTEFVNRAVVLYQVIE